MVHGVVGDGQKPQQQIRGQRQHQATPGGGATLPTQPGWHPGHRAFTITAFGGSLSPKARSHLPLELQEGRPQGLPGTQPQTSPQSQGHPSQGSCGGLVGVGDGVSQELLQGEKGPAAHLVKLVWI